MDLMTGLLTFLEILMEELDLMERCSSTLTILMARLDLMEGCPSILYSDIQLMEGFLFVRSKFDRETLKNLVDGWILIDSL